jgi:hypothetical protein
MLGPSARCWWSKSIDRLVANQFRVCLADLVEEDRLQVGLRQFRDHFCRLISVPIARPHPSLVINVDEMEFSSVKSGRLKNQQFVVPQTFKRRLAYQAKLDSHFISAITAIE